MESDDTKPKLWLMVVYDDTGRVIASRTVHGKCTKSEAEQRAREYAEEVSKFNSAVAASGVQHT